MRTRLKRTSKPAGRSGNKIRKPKAESKRSSALRKLVRNKGV